MSETFEDSVSEILNEAVEEPAFVPSDTAEPITAEEALQTDIPLPQEASPEEAHVASLVCDVCLELNLTTKSVIKCARCEQAFCYHFASAVDAQYCVNCMSDISVSKSTITKTYESTNQETGIKTFYRRRAREIKIDGMSWLFAQRRIKELGDEELDMVIEYHRNVLSLLIDESERRRNEKMHRYANVKMVIPTAATTKVTDTSSTTTKRTRTVSKTKANEGVAALLSSLLAKGMKLEDIAAQIAGKK